jgi:cytochrome b subunit of formate dehydrogenase
MVPADMILHKYIFDDKGKSGKRELIAAWLKILNLTGMIGMSGLLITGIVLVLLNPAFGFFQFTANHWLAAKQIIMVALIVITGAYIIPLGKRVKSALGADLENSEPLSAEARANIRTIAKLSALMGVLIVINFLFGALHSIAGLF